MFVRIGKNMIIDIDKICSIDTDEKLIRLVNGNSVRVTQEVMSNLLDMIDITDLTKNVKLK